jgi:hypothetical protein
MNSYSKESIKIALTLSSSSRTFCLPKASTVTAPLTASPKVDIMGKRTTLTCLLAASARLRKLFQQDKIHGNKVSKNE